MVRLDEIRTVPTVGRSEGRIVLRSQRINCPQCGNQYAIQDGFSNGSCVEVLSVTCECGFHKDVEAETTQRMRDAVAKSTGCPLIAAIKAHRRIISEQDA
jgi:hypothetical protein